MSAHHTLFFGCECCVSTKGVVILDSDFALTDLLPVFEYSTSRNKILLCF